MNDYMLFLLKNCNDANLGSIMTLIKNTLYIIHIIVPILLIIVIAIRLAQLVRYQDEKKNIPRIRNAFFAAVIVFFLPTIVNAIIQAFDGSTISACWNSASYTSGTSYQNPDNKIKHNPINTDPSDYQKGEAKKEESTPSTDTSTSDTSSTSTKTPSEEDKTGPTTTSGNYGPVLKGSNFHFSKASTTGGCSGGAVVHDLGIKTGTPVYASIDGTADFIQYVCDGVLYSYGNQVRLTDSSTGTYILYGHLSSFVGVNTPVTKTCHEVYGKNASCGYSACSSGIKKKSISKKSVKRGELLGYTGNTGNSSGPHLHIEIHENGSKKCVTDPYKAMGMR